jgi:hypothetical protein
LRHDGVVNSASFSPDGSKVVTACGTATRVWDAATCKPLGEPLRHDDFVNSASFSPDGSKVVTASNDETARIWQVGAIMHPPIPVPQAVREWATGVAGWRFDAEGVMQPVAGEKRFDLLNAPHDGNDSWSRLMRWVEEEPGKRTIDPDSQMTCREMAERERDFGSYEGPESALRYDTTVPLARLMLAKFEGNPVRAAFLRAYDLKRLPDDAGLWSRASEILGEQGQGKAALDAAQKAVRLDPKLPAAQEALAEALKGGR